MKIRLLGAAVLFALAAIFLPMIFSGKTPAPAGDQSVSLAIPPSPDRDLQTKTMSLTPDAAVVPAAAPPAAAGTAPATPAAVVTPGSGSQLATVDIGSRRPRDVQTDPEAGRPPQPTTVVTGSGASPSQPVIPMQNDAGRKPVAAAPTRPTPSPTPSPAAVEAASTAATAAHGNYLVNLSAYASKAGAAQLERRVRALGYPVGGHAITQAGQPRTLVIAGPFETRTAAEAARLHIARSIPGVPARLQQDAGMDSAAVPAAARPAAVAPRAGGWAVQLAAMSAQADANALRDKLRAAGFDGYVDSVTAGGKRLWRVRAGPQTQRADAQRLHDQIKAKLGVDGNIVSVP